jgi:nucleoside-diphosphate-sugar epimerase
VVRSYNIYMSYFSGKTILVTGAAGFIGSHLVDRLLLEGARVTGVDNFISGKRENLELALGYERFSLIEEDVVEWGGKLQGTSYKEQVHYDYIFHLASPASPPRYQEHPVETYMVNSMGTHYLLLLAQEMKARFLYTSTSEAYGDPLEHPQKETYFGNVNPIGPRAMYDESKRFGEMACSVFTKKGVDARIVRIFNTYGPRMDPKDGRVFPAFISQALSGEHMTVEGDGKQTRSFCYVDDLVEYLVRAMSTEGLAGEIINIGNPDEHAVVDMAEKIKQMTQSNSDIIHVEARNEDIARRQPDISKAKQLLGYEPQVGLEEGLEKTINDFRERITDNR